MNRRTFLTTTTAATAALARAATLRTTARVSEVDAAGHIAVAKQTCGSNQSDGAKFGRPFPRHDLGAVQATRGWDVRRPPTSAPERFG